MKTIQKVNLFYGETTIAECFLGSAKSFNGKMHYCIEWSSPVYFEVPKGTSIKEDLLGKTLDEVKFTKVQPDEETEESEGSTLDGLLG